MLVVFSIVLVVLRKANKNHFLLKRKKSGRRLQNTAEPGLV